jgi:uncharacterized metal-binding protein
MRGRDFEIDHCRTSSAWGTLYLVWARCLCLTKVPSKTALLDSDTRILSSRGILLTSLSCIGGVLTKLPISDLDFQLKTSPIAISSELLLALAAGRCVFHVTHLAYVI